MSGPLASKIPARPMEYPYTFVSKLVNFPFKMYYKHGNWRFRYLLYGYIATIPFFYQMHKALNSPANHEKLRQVKAKEHQEHLEHLKHLK